MTNQSNGWTTSAAAGGEVLLSTDLVASKQRADFWREACGPTFDVWPLSTEPSKELLGSIRVRPPLGGLLIASTSFSAQNFSRDRRVIVRGGLDQYMVQLCTSGSMVGDFSGVSVAVGPGDIFVLDLAQTARNRATAGGRIITNIPRAALDRATGQRNLHGRVLSGALPTTRLIASYMRGLGDLSEHPAVSESSAIEEALIVLLAAALRGDDRGDMERYAPLGRALRERVLEFISHNIELPELRPDLIASRLNVSRAQLYRAFVSDGGVATVIRERRLDAAFVELTRSSAAGRSIADVAYAFGLPSGNQLLRGFRARFGMTPSMARQNHLPAQQIPDLHAYYVGLLDRVAGRA